MNVQNLVTAMRRAGYEGHARNLAPRLARYGIPVDIEGATTTVRIRYATSEREGPGGSLVAEDLMMGRVVATEAGPARLHTAESGGRVRSLRVPDDLWAQVNARASERGVSAAAVILAAVRAHLREQP